MSDPGFFILLPAHSSAAYNLVSGDSPDPRMKASAKRRMKVRINPMKKILSVVMVLMLALGLMIPVFSSAESVVGHKTMWVVCADGKRLNVRYLPTRSSKILYRIENGDSLTILHDEPTPEGWAMVRKGNKQVGYVMTKFLKANKPGKYDLNERSDNFKKVDSYIVIAKALNNKTNESVGLRTNPTKKSTAIRRLMAGDLLEVIAVGKVWSQVVDPQTGKTGYVANDYIVRK